VEPTSMREVEADMNVPPEVDLSLISTNRTILPALTTARKNLVLETKSEPGAGLWN